MSTRPLLAVTTAHPSLFQHPDPRTGRAPHPHLARLVQPRHFSSIEATAAAGIPWMADNDCFQGLDMVAFDAMLERLKGVPGCVFVAVPDVVGDAQATADQWVRWQSAPRRRGLPLAFVAQDGCEHGLCPPAWQFDALFIGGTTEWKLGPGAASLARAAKRAGLWVHWGRVNTRRRLEYAVSTGACDSVDGSSWARWRHARLDMGLQWCVDAAARPSLFFDGLEYVA